MMDKNYYVHSYLPNSFYWAFGLNFATLIFALLAFISPYWIESYDIVHSDFVRIGIWMACFNGFIHPQDYNAREFYGCLFLYDRSFGDLWFYINPWWLVGVQVILTVAMLLHIGCFLAYCGYFWYKMVRLEYRVCITISSAIAQFFSSLCWGTSVILYGVESQNRLWIPRPDQNLISWAYWSANVTCALSMVAAVMAYIQTRELNMLKVEEERARAQLMDDPFVHGNTANWQADSADGGDVGVLQIGALPVDYEKDSHGIFASQVPMYPEQYPIQQSQMQINAPGPYSGMPGILN